MNSQGFHVSRVGSAMPTDIARASFGFAVAISCGLALCACSEPLQNGGVVVFGVASARFDAMCRFRRGSGDGQTSCAAPSADVQHARALRIAGESQLVKGSRAEGSVGDVLLTNGEISVVVGGLSSPRPGVILDIVDAHVGHDELGALSPCVADGAECLPLAPPEFGQQLDGSAWVEVRVSERAHIDARTRFTLLPGARSLLVTTIVSSRSTEPQRLTRIGDVVSWGSSQVTVPVGETPPFVAAVGADVAYAIMPVDDRPGVALDPLEGAMFVRHAQDVVVHPGQTVRLDRAFVVAPRGDTLGVLTEMSFLRDGQAPGAIELRFVGTDGVAMPPPAGGRVRVLSPSFPVEGFWAMGRAPEGSLVAAEAPAGKYELDFDGAGRRAMGKVSVEVRPGKIVQATLVLGASESVGP